MENLGTGLSYLHENIPLVEELFDTCGEMTDFILVQGGEEAQAFLPDFSAAVESLAAAVTELLPLVQYPNKLELISVNMPLLAERLLGLSQNGDFAALDMKLRCEFRPLFLYWRVYFGFFMVECTNAEEMRRHNQAEMEWIAQLGTTEKADSPQEYAYDLSIVVLLYGKKEMTADCIRAIQAHTTHCTYELITIDNGSDAETTAWVNSLPHTKKIHYPVNIGSSAAGNTAITFAMEYIDGKYLAFIANDVILTPGWDRSLFACMESDPRVIMAVPTTNSLSNAQTISVPYEKNHLPQMQRFAREYNSLNPCRWSDRARLFAFMGVLRQEAIAQIGLFCSPYFCFDMFADDDSSTKLRRAGYRQVLCMDVFVHHYGSATIGDGQYNVMEKGRAQFFDKYGVDAWDSLGMTGAVFAQFIKGEKDADVRILVLEPKFGESGLLLKNKLREQGCEIVVFDGLTTDPRFLADMEQIFDASGLLDECGQVIDGKQYDLILYEGYFEDSYSMDAYAALAAGHLATNGRFLLQIRNFNAADRLLALLSDQDPNQSYERERERDPAVGAVRLTSMQQYLAVHGLDVQATVSVKSGNTQGKQLLDAFATVVQMPAMQQTAKNIDVSAYALICGCGTAETGKERA